MTHADYRLEVIRHWRCVNPCSKLNGMAEPAKILSSVPRVVSDADVPRHRMSRSARFPPLSPSAETKFTPERAMILDAVLRRMGLFEARRL